MAQSYQRKTADQWRALVNDQQQSNLSGAKFCQQHDISYASFCKWKQRFSRSQKSSRHDTSDFVDLSSMASAVLAFIPDRH